jgi:hypothetical protein
MIALLATYFLIGNETTEKRQAFYALHMHDTETFLEFKAKFISLATQGKVAPSEWSFYYWEKITGKLRLASAPIKLN